MSSSLWTTEANGYLTFCVSVAFLYSVIFCFFNCDFHKKGNAGLIEEQENEDEKEYILLPPSTEGLIEVDDTLYFIKAVGYLCQLGRE